MNNLKLGSAGEALIKQYEQFRPTAYLPTPHDVPTIGWGHTHGVKMGDTCTQPTAEAWFQQDVAGAAAEVNKVVTVPLKPNQFDALVSLAFNIGVGNFGGSTLVRKLNAGDIQGAAGQFAVWNKQGGRVLNGLVTRRAAEAALFLHT